jgi:hypothetical protein
MFLKINAEGRLLKMKNKWIYDLLIILAFGVVLAGCDTGTGGGGGDPSKSIKITGITLITGTDTNGEAYVFIYTKPEFGHGLNSGLIAREVYHSAEITNGELLVDLYVCDDGYDASDVPWTGKGEYYINLGFAGPTGWPDDVEGGTVLRYWWAKDG